jgi:cation:H+ antiporter
MEYVLFVIGFVLLIKGADWLVSGASSIAKSYNISDMVVGLTIVSFGTSMPELVVNIMASLDNKAGIAIGNVFGSNIANVLLILGVASVIHPLSVQRNTIMAEVPYSLVAVLLVGFLANTKLFSQEATNSELSRIDGIMLLFFFSLFMVYVVFLTKQEQAPHEDGKKDVIMPLGKSILFVVLGIVGLYFGGEWVVEGAVKLASILGMSESVIGLTVVAIGTSLPELVTSAFAAYRKNSDIAVGNVVGSNIFNIVWILGLSATINPLPFNTENNADVLMIIIASVMLIMVLPLGKKGKIDRMNGIIFLLTYTSYIVYLLKR